MTEKLTRPFGLWDSPISPRNLAEAKRLDGVAWDSATGTLVWLEGRSGRGVLVAQSIDDGNAPRDLTGDWDVRAEVGYGGGDFGVHGGCVYFVVHKTGRIHRQPLAVGAARPITPTFGSAAAPTVSPDGRLVAYVHHDDEGNDRIAVVDAHGCHWPRILAAGHDFYMQPRWSPDGKRLAYVAWDHPNMPWDGTWLYVADVVDDGSLPRLDQPRVIAGSRDTAIFQPEFTPDGRLLYVSDETGWGRIWLHDLATGERRPLTPDGVECAMPGWVQGMRTYCVLANGRRIVAARGEQGFDRIVEIDLADGQTAAVEPLRGYSEVSGLVAAANGERIAFVGAGPQTPPRVVMHDLSNGRTRVVARSLGETVPPESLAPCEPIQWTTAGNETAYGLFYPPTSKQFVASGDPPLVVIIHGGPTSQVKAGWRADAQFFATRGYAVLYVNYRGGTGYGRDYMLRLRGNWGVCDCEDAVSGMRHVVQQGRAAANKTIILGGSAGGFTVLQTMIDNPEVFAAGVCLYGVADQFHLAAQTHKFESRYLDTLLGPLPEAAEVYRRRSPVLHAERIRRPLAVFQGGIDRVVPQAQSDRIVEALRRSGTPHVYHLYPEEGHGWRRRETIEHFYRTVDEFLRQYVIFA